MKVTFDCRTWQPIIGPEIFPSDVGIPNLTKLQNAVRNGLIEGFISETVARAPYFANLWPRIEGHMMIGVSGSAPARDAIIDQFTMAALGDWVKVAVAKGFRFLSSPPFGAPWSAEFSMGVPVEQDDGESARAARFLKIANCLTHRGFGRARANLLAMSLSKQVHRTDTARQHFQCPDEEGEQIRIHDTFNEWADADAIASHIAYDNDLFCTSESGRGHQDLSVLDPSNRAWLTATYNVQFITLAELVTRVSRE